MTFPLWKIMLLGPWTGFWMFLAATTYVPSVRDWWERNDG